jgi:RNA polymerase sigma factor (sigma-70 family)
MPDHARLLDDLKEDDQETWEQFYNSYLLPLRTRLTKQFENLSPEEIDDIWATVIEKVYQKIGTVKVPRALGSWLWQVARSQALDYLKIKKLRRQLLFNEGILSDQVKQTEVLPDDNPASPRLREAFEAMSPVHRTLLTMRAEGAPPELIYCFTGLEPRQQCATLGYVRFKVESTN